MEYDLSLIIKAINEVNDNIWLGDFEKAKQIAVSNLKRISPQLEISAFQEIADELRRTIREIRKTARETGVEKKRLWVAEQVAKDIVEKEVEPLENIYGVLAIHLSSLKDAVSHLLALSNQSTLERLAERGFEKESLQRKERYRYAIRRLPDRWEVRAILDTPAVSWDLVKLGDRFSNFNVSLEEALQDRASRTFELYSRDMYIQVIGQENRVEIVIYTPGQVPNVERRVSNSANAILNTLIVNE